MKITWTTSSIVESLEKEILLYSAQFPCFTLKFTTSGRPWLPGHVLEACYFGRRFKVENLDVYMN